MGKKNIKPQQPLRNRRFSLPGTPPGGGEEGRREERPEISWPPKSLLPQWHLRGAFLLAEAIEL